MKTFFRDLKKKFRNWFLAGILVLLPLSLTYLIFRFLFVRLGSVLSPVIEKAFNVTGVVVPNIYSQTLFTILGAASAILITIGVGMFTRNMIGKTMILAGERIVSAIPLVRNVYILAKQILEAFTTHNSRAFQETVLVEYPRNGIYSIGFLTCDTTGIVSVEAEFAELLATANCKNVFVPTTPNPTSGMLVIVPENQIHPLQITPEAAVKFIVSGGIVHPDTRLKKDA